METYPEEVLTPPLALVALLGRSDLHASISEYLRTEHRPPINSIGAAELSSGLKLFGDQKEKAPEVQGAASGGVIKSGWLTKHRKRSAAVAVAFFNMDSLSSDPTSWARTCSQVDTIKAATRIRGAKLVILVVQDGANIVDLPEERAVTIRRRAELESRCLLSYSTVSPAASMRRLGMLLQDLTVAYYREEGQQAIQRLNKASSLSNPSELSTRCCFKVGALAEFRQDWGTALKYYSASYSHLQDLLTAQVAWQRFSLLARTAELVHYKLCTLLLHSGSVVEAVDQFRQHVRLFKRRVLGQPLSKTSSSQPGPQQAPPAVLMEHFLWLSRQYRIFGELLTSRAPKEPPSPFTREQYPGFYFHAAASAMIQSHSKYEQVLEAYDSENEELLPAGHVVKPGPYWGQLLVSSSGGDKDKEATSAEAAWTVERPLTELEWRRHILSLHRQVPHAVVATELLGKAHEQFKAQGGGCPRLCAQVVSQMANQYITLQDYAAARCRLSSVAAVYRREGWEALLCSTLKSLRECARRLGMHREHAESSLELAALRRCVDQEQRMALFTSALAVLTTQPTPTAGSEEVSNKEGGGEDEETSSAPGPTTTSSPQQQLSYLINDTSPLRTVLSCAVCFRHPSVTLGEKVTFTVAMQARVPLDLPLWKLEVHFNDPQYNTQVGAQTWEGKSGLKSEEGGQEQDAQQEEEGERDGQAVLVLRPHQWVYTNITLSPASPCKLECVGVVAHVGPASSFRWELGSHVPGTTHSSTPVPAAAPTPATSTSTPSNPVVVRVPPRPPPMASLAPPLTHRGPWGVIWLTGQQPSRTLSVEEPQPSASLSLTCSSPALSGEYFPVTVTVKSEHGAISAGLLHLRIENSDPIKSAGGTGTPAESAANSAANSVKLFQEVVAEPAPTSTASCISSSGPEDSTADATGDDAEPLLPPHLRPLPGGRLAVPYIPSGGTHSATLRLLFPRFPGAAAAAAVPGRTLRAHLTWGGPHQGGSSSGGGEGSGSLQQGPSVQAQLPLDCEEPIRVDYSFATPFRTQAAKGGDLLHPASPASPSSPLPPPTSLPANQPVLLTLTSTNTSSVGLKVKPMRLSLHRPDTCQVLWRSGEWSAAEGKEGKEGKEGEEGEEGEEVSDPGTAGVVLLPGAAITEIISILPKDPGSAVPLTLGEIIVPWRRLISSSLGSDRRTGESLDSPVETREDSSRDDSWITHSSPLPEVLISVPPVVVTTHCPPQGVLGVPFTYTVVLHNHTHRLQEVSVNVLDAAGFLFSGERMGVLGVLPHATSTLQYCFVAISNGIQTLPDVRLTLQPGNVVLSLPATSRRIYIYPDHQSSMSSPNTTSITCP